MRKIGPCDSMLSGISTKHVLGDMQGFLEYRWGRLVEARLDAGFGEAWEGRKFSEYR